MRRPLMIAALALLVACGNVRDREWPTLADAEKVEEIAKKLTNEERELLLAAGWDAHATKASGDQGADVLAERNGARAVLQCKLYSNPVGNKAVQEAHAARAFYEAKWAIVVSNRTYTPSARELAQSLGVVLVHHDELATLHALLEG